MDRRKFMTKGMLTSAGMMLGVGSFANQEAADAVQRSDDHDPFAAKNRAGYDIMKELKKYKKIDAHCHVYLFDGGPESNIAMADRLQIDKMVVSRPIYEETAGRPDEFIAFNNLVVKAMKAYPGRFIGQFTCNPIFQQESLEEIKRCVDLGMCGLKVYTQKKISDPLFYPIIEKMIDLKMIIHMHAQCQLGVGGYRMKYDTGIRPQTSIPEDFIAAAKRYPEAMFQYAHIGGGGDWEYACKSFVGYPNIYVDSSGSNNPEHMVDFAVQQLGVTRVLYGTDNCYYQSVGKLLASNLPVADLKKVFFDNYNAILKKSGRHVN
ncbi:MAG TPA: amidohydrolase family protein [Flavihumibacter sp.]|nr:amidohydrolase family protein [Flavihumibacter sp.]